MRVRHRSAAVGLVFAACTSSVEPPAPAPAPVSIGPAGGIVRSADGVVELEVQPGETFTRELSIVRTRNYGIGGAYQIVAEEAGGPTVFARPAELRFRAGAAPSLDHFAFVALDADRELELDGYVYSPARSLVFTPLTTVLQTREYAVVDRTWSPCASRSCGEGCTPCPSSDPRCVPRTTTSFCDQTGRCVDGSAPRCDSSGAAGPLGEGDTYVVNFLRLAPSDTGFDLDGFCPAPGRCADNLGGSRLGAKSNDQIRGAVFIGELRFVLEISPDASALDVYAAVDVDDPPFPANDLHPLEGEDTCCELLVSPLSLDGEMQSRARVFLRPAGERLISSAPAQHLHLPVLWGQPPHDALGLGRAFVTLRRTESGLDGILGGAMTFAELTRLANPYCSVRDETCDPSFERTSLLELVIAQTREQADVDLDGDGLERFADLDRDGRFDHCYDGCIGPCTAPVEVAPIDPADPRSCALAPEMADGYSIAFEFTAVHAKILGVASR